MPPKTTIEKSQSPNPDVTIFKIAGTLGFHEKTTLEKLFDECRKRGMCRVVLDMAEVTSLGGGCAQILRDEAVKGEIKLGIVGAKKTALRFLTKEPVEEIVIADSRDEAISAVLNGEPASAVRGAPLDVESDDDLLSEDSLDAILAPERAAPQEEGASHGATPSTVTTQVLQAEHVRATDTLSRPARAPEAPSQPRTARAPVRPAADLSVNELDQEIADTRVLQKRIIQYNTILSLNSDFYGIRDRKSLLELFLLTTIAQVGVESAVFLEHSQGYFVPTAMKGLEAEEVRGFALSTEQMHLEEWREVLDVYGIDETPFGDDVKAPLLSLGCSYVAPFVVHGKFCGIVLLGRPFKGPLDEATIEFLKILINQSALAYGSMARFEEENERTLGLVRSLISMIEENTLARGNTNLISNYVFALAQGLHYAEEHVRDLMYGTVLRDIGMIKVSDLIVRSPRELMPEEWEVIKGHPVDGADMLRRMRFSEHTCAVVRTHHERFNGEGYPDGVQGQEIPLGARIVSVVESYAAMLQDRPTRPALTSEEALNTLKENWGLRYDPDAVKQFASMIEEEIRSGQGVANRKFELFGV